MFSKLCKQSLLSVATLPLYAHTHLTGSAQEDTEMRDQASVSLCVNEHDPISALTFYTLLCPADTFPFFHKHALSTVCASRYDN